MRCTGRLRLARARLQRLVGTWADEASIKPVSPETLAGIPWAGRSTLTGLFQRVASSGPKDPSVWSKLVKRADVIAHSFTPRQAALVLSALAKVQHRDESFMRRFSVKFAPSLVLNAELLDLCGIVSSLSQLDAYCEETFDLAARRARESAPQMDARQLSLIANAFVRVSHTDPDLFHGLLQQLPRRLGKFECRDIAVFLNAFAQGREGLRSMDLAEQLEPIALRLPDLLPTADLQSLTIILNAFAKLQFAQKDTLDLLVDELLSRDDRLKRTTPQQLAMVVNAAAKLQLFEPRLLEALVTQIRVKARRLDAQALCVIANASAKLQLGVDTFQVLYEQMPRHLTRLAGRQMAMICHAWAKAHVHNDDLFACLVPLLAKRVRDLSAHEVALAVYGYAHFRKSPPELFGPLLRHFAELLREGGVRDGDLLMVANALGRIGHRDDGVADALRSYTRREPSMKNLSRQALATFALLGE